MLNVTGLDTYYAGAHILHRVSLNVNRGEVVVLLGRNGAGKSTTLKSLIGLVRPRRGRITLDGKRLDGLPVHAIARAGLGYVPEDRRIFSRLTVAQNLEVGRLPAREDAPRWTTGRIFELFPHLAGLTDRPAGRLSGGEQQMLTVARTLMGNPRLILLDEPSEGLAPVVIEQMADTIVSLKAQGLTVLLSEQNLDFAAHVADRAYVIDKGRIRYEGSMSSLESDPEVRDSYLGV